MHVLKNGHPAHVFTDEDRRKGAAVTNETRRAKHELFEQERINRELEEYFARLEARRWRKREKQHARRAAEAARARVGRSQARGGWTGEGWRGFSHRPSGSGNEAKRDHEEVADGVREYTDERGGDVPGRGSLCVGRREGRGR